MKVLITGALGNLGVMCVEQALAMGYSVKCLDIPNSNNKQIAKALKARYASNRIETVWADIRDISHISDLLTDIDGIIHNASLLPPLTDSKPMLAKAINVDATRNLIKLAEKQQRSIRFIFPSSVTVFGFASTDEAPKSAVDETKATDNYTLHKLSCEKALQDSTLSWCILRVGVSVDHRTTKTDFKTLKGLLQVNAKNPLEYVHPKDVALAMCTALTAEQAPNKVLLIGGGNDCQITQSDFLNGSLQGLGLKLADKSFGLSSYYTHWMDTEESQQILNYQRHSFNDYKQEMATTFKTLKIILTPIRPLANWVLNRFVSKLSSA